MSDKLVLPSQIPWDSIKGKDLEELLYWLFDSMGARDLEWRIGGKGAGAPDQGRDLELSFYASSPDGDLEKQRWWIEAKGRTTTVDRNDVTSAVHNAAGKSNVDVVVIATNSSFSNPTRDWVKEWQRDHTRPKVKLWQRAELESLCSKNPIAVIRLFSEALSPQGKLEVTKAKLWDYASFTDEPTLTKLWQAREKIAIDARALFALVSSEVANGDINERTWAVFANADTLLQSLGEGLTNFLYLAFRANDTGVRQAPIIAALAHLVLVCCDRVGSASTSKVLSAAWDSVEGTTHPERARKVILRAVLQLLQNHVRDVCTSDCERVTTDPVILSQKEIEKYWQQLSMGSRSKKDREILVVEMGDKPCKVGFPLDRKTSCPLCHNDSPEENILQTLEVVKAVADFRRSNR